MSGFITNSFTSAFNVYRDTLVINNIDLGVPVDNISINPNDSYTNQSTQYGSVKILWPHLSLTGDVQLFIKYITQAQVDAIERACRQQDTNIYISFAGYMYRTEHIDYSIVPSNGGKSLDITLSFYGVLPYSTPVFRPKFSTLTDSTGLVMSTTIFSTTSKGHSYALLPLPGCSLSTREDVTAFLTHRTDNKVDCTISSDVRDFSSSTTSGIINALSNNTDQHYSQVINIVKTSEGEDTFIAAKYIGSTIKLSKYVFKYNNNSITMTATNLTDISIPYLSSMYIADSKLFVWTLFSNTYKLISYDLLSNNAMQEIINSSNIHQPVAGVDMFYPFTYKFSASHIYGFKDKTLLAVSNLPTDVETYGAYKLSKSDFSYIPGVDPANLQGILFADKLEDNRIIVFPKGLTLSNNESVLYAVFNFRNYNEEQNQYSNPRLLGYKTGTAVTDYSQLFLTTSYIQTNTAVIAGGHMFMTTEAYTDFYKEDNIIAMTLSTNQHKYYAIDLGSKIEIRILTK